MLGAHRGRDHHLAGNLGHHARRRAHARHVDALDVRDLDRRLHRRIGALDDARHVKGSIDLIGRIERGVDVLPRHAHLDGLACVARPDEVHRKAREHRERPLVARSDHDGLGKHRLHARKRPFGDFLLLLNRIEHLEGDRDGHLDASLAPRDPARDLFGVGTRLLEGDRVAFVQAVPDLARAFLARAVVDRRGSGAVERIDRGPRKHGNRLRGLDAQHAHRNDRHRHVVPAGNAGERVGARRGEKAAREVVPRDRQVGVATALNRHVDGCAQHALRLHGPGRLEVDEVLALDIEDVLRGSLAHMHARGHRDLGAQNPSRDLEIARLGIARRIDLIPRDAPEDVEHIAVIQGYVDVRGQVGGYAHDGRDLGRCTVLRSGAHGHLGRDRVIGPGDVALGLEGRARRCVLIGRGLLPLDDELLARSVRHGHGHRVRQRRRHADQGGDFHRLARGLGPQHLDLHLDLTIGAEACLARDGDGRGIGENLARIRHGPLDLLLAARPVRVGDVHEIGQLRHDALDRADRIECVD